MYFRFRGWCFSTVAWSQWPDFRRRNNFQFPTVLYLAQFSLEFDPGTRTRLDLGLLGFCLAIHFWKGEPAIQSDLERH